MGEIYCSECKHLVTEYVVASHGCDFPKNIEYRTSKTWLSTEVLKVRLREPKDINLLNNCTWFGPKEE